MLTLFLMHRDELRVFVEHYGDEDQAVDVAGELAVAQDKEVVLVRDSCPTASPIIRWPVDDLEIEWYRELIAVFSKCLNSSLDALPEDKRLRQVSNLN
jgi:hypothetical protein